MTSLTDALYPNGIFQEKRKHKQNGIFSESPSFPAIWRNPTILRVAYDNIHLKVTPEEKWNTVIHKYCTSLKLSYPRLNGVQETYDNAH